MTVSAADDSDGRDESVTIGNAAAGGGYNGKSANYKATVTDDDRGLTLSPASVTVAEGSTETYTVKLAAEPAASVTVAVSRTSGDTDLTVDKSSLTFTTSNYNTSQTVTVSAAEDNDYLDGTATYTHTASGGDYGNVSAALTATEDDNDLPPITLSLNPTSVDENASPTAVTVTTDRTGSVSVTTVTVKVGKSTDSAISGTDYAAVSDFTITIADGTTSKTGTFTLAPIDNDVDENDKTLTVWATVEGFEVAATNLTLVDDDEPQTVGTFNVQTIANQVYVQDSAIATLTLPAATGDGVLTYSLSPALPDGLVFDADARTITGTPTVVMPETSYTYTVTGEGGDVATLTFTITVIAADKKPVFVDAIGDQIYTQNTAIATLTLPTATGGDSTLTYSLSPSPPDGLVFDADARTITGTPTVVMAETSYTYTVTDIDGDTATLTFTITVIAADKKPVFVDAIGDQIYTQNTAIATLTLPTATGGDGVLTYSLSPAPPDGLGFDTDARTITGTPSVVMAETSYTYTATDTDGDTATLTFTITVVELIVGGDGTGEGTEIDSKPVFSDAIDNQIYLQNSAIATLTLPVATGGDGVLTYALSPDPPDGLTFDADGPHSDGHAECGHGRDELHLYSDGCRCRFCNIDFYNHSG